MYNLGNALQFQAKYEEAMSLHLQALSVRELQGQQPKIAQSVARVAEVCVCVCVPSQLPVSFLSV